MKLWFAVYRKSFLFTFLLLPITVITWGQSSNLLNVSTLKGTGNINIQSLVDRQIKYIQESYSSEIEASKELINGKEYESYYTRSQSKPLLFVNKKRTASIFTRSRRYNDLTLQYDTFLDEVIYTDTTRMLYDRYPQIALNKDIVVGFNLYFQDDSLLFRYFRPPDCTKHNLKEGFYEIAYQGKSNYIIKHTSSFYVREGRHEYKYEPENYISAGDVYYRVKSKRSLLKLFGEKSGEVKRYMHSSRIRIRQADKNQFVSIMKFYDSLSSSR
jgi:hypothetical protein